MTLDAIVGAFEEAEEGAEQSLLEGTGPLPFVPMVPGASTAAPVTTAQPTQPPAQILGVDVPKIPSPGEVLKGLGLVNIFEPLEIAGEKAADWLVELVTHKEEEKKVSDAGGDTRQEDMSDALQIAVQSKQKSLGGWLAMGDLDPGFPKRAAEGALSAIWNQDEKKRSSVFPPEERRYYAPSEFNVSLNTDTGDLVFTNPDTGRVTPFDSYAITPADFSQILTDLKPAAYEVAGAIVGSVLGTAIGGFSGRPEIAYRTGVMAGVLGEALGAIQANYDRRTGALLEQGLRPVKWSLPTDDPDDPYHQNLRPEGEQNDRGPLRWVFWNKGGGEGGFFDGTEKTYTDAAVFSKGAFTQGLWAAGGAGVAGLLYKLYRWNRGSPGANIIGDISSSRDLARAIRAQGRDVDAGNLLAQSLNTPQIMFRYADDLGRQASEASAAGNKRLYDKLKREELRYRDKGEQFQSALIGLGGGTTGIHTAEDIARQTIERETGIETSQVIGGPSATRGGITAEDIADQEILETGELIISSLSDDAAARATAGLTAVTSSVDGLKRALLNVSGQLRRGDNAAGVEASQAPFVALTKKIDEAKTYLFGGVDPATGRPTKSSFFEDELFVPARDGLNKAVGFPKRITISAPSRLKNIRAAALKRKNNELPEIDSFIRGLAQDLNLPQPVLKAERITGFKGAEVTASVDLISNKIKELRALKGNLKTDSQHKVAEELDRTLVSLRAQLARNSDAYKSEAGKAQINARLRELSKVDKQYAEAKRIYSRSVITDARNAVADRPVSERNGAFFEKLIPPGIAPDDLDIILNDLKHGDFGLRTSDTITVENMLTDGLFQTYINKVYKGADVEDLIRDFGGDLKPHYNLKAHNEFMDQYGTIFKRLLTDPKADAATVERAARLFDEFSTEPVKMFREIGARVDAYKALNRAIENKSYLKDLGIDAPFDPATTVDKILTQSPSSYSIFRTLVKDLKVNPDVRNKILADMDDTVKSLFIRKVGSFSPSGGISIDGKKIQEVLRRSREVDEQGRLGDALATVFTGKERDTLKRLGRDLEILQHEAEVSGKILPHLKNSLLDFRTPIGAMARVYVGVLNTRARALTAAQRVLGGKAERVLLDALLHPEKALKLSSKRISKPGPFKKSLINLIGATTGVYLGEDDADEIANIAQITTGDIEFESALLPEREKQGAYPDVRKTKIYDVPVKVPSLNIPSYETLLQTIPFADVVMPESVRSQRPFTVESPPGLTQAIQQGAEKLPGVGIASLREAEQRKMIGLPFNKGGIVNARRPRQIVL